MPSFLDISINDNSKYDKHMRWYDFKEYLNEKKNLNKEGLIGDNVTR